MPTPLEEITESIKIGLNEEEINEKVLRDFLDRFVTQGRAVQNIVVDIASKHLKHFQKKDVKEILKDLGNGGAKRLKDIILEEDDTKPYLIIAQQVLECFHLITLEESEKKDGKYDTMMMFKNYSYHTNLTPVKKFISRACREYNVNHEATFRNVMHYLQIQTLFSSDDFNYDDKVMVFPNGVYDFRKNRFGRFRNPEEKFFFYELNVPYKEGHYDCPKFKKLLVQWLDEKSSVMINGKASPHRKGTRIFLINDVFEAIGLCMTMKSDLKSSFMNYGNQNSGKTQFFNILTHIIGKRNMSGTSLQRLGGDQFGAEGMEFKILNYVGDLPASTVSDMGLFKSQTGDDQMVESEHKFGKKHYPKYVHKFWVNANKVPRLKWDDTASYDRFIMIHFPNEFKRSEGEGSIWKSIVKDENEVQGIIHEAIRGFKRLLNRGYFREILREDTIHTWKYHSDQIYAFLHDYCEKVPRERIEVNEMFLGYSEINAGESMNSLTKGLSRHGIRRRQGRSNGKQTDFYYGVKWKDDNPIKFIDYDPDIDEILEQPKKKKASSSIKYSELDEF